MQDLKKPAFEQLKSEYIRRKKPLPMKDLNVLRGRIVELLESDDRLIVQKGSVTHHHELMLDFKCSWLGVDAEYDATLYTVRGLWNDEVFGEGALTSFTSYPEDEKLLFAFVAEIGDRFVTGHIRVLGI